MMLVWGPHFKNHCNRADSNVSVQARTFPGMMFRLCTSVACKGEEGSETKAEICVQFGNQRDQGLLRLVIQIESFAAICLHYESVLDTEYLRLILFLQEMIEKPFQPRKHLGVKKIKGKRGLFRTVGISGQGTLGISSTGLKDNQKQLQHLHLSYACLFLIFLRFLPPSFLSFYINPQAK